MSDFNNLSNANTPSMPKSRSRKISPILVGGIVLAFIGGIGNMVGQAGHQTNQPPMTAPYSGDRTADNGQYGSSQGAGAEQSENGYTPQGSNDATASNQAPAYQAPAYQAPPYQAPAYQTPSTEGDATDNGYAAREKAQDQSAQAFDGYIRDTDTVRDTGNGQVYTNVPNDQADAAVQSGAATEVPTNELPTSEDSSAASTPDTSASDTSTSE